MKVFLKVGDQIRQQALTAEASDIMFDEVGISESEYRLAMWLETGDKRQACNGPITMHGILADPTTG